MLDLPVRHRVACAPVSVVDSALVQRRHRAWIGCLLAWIWIAVFWGGTGSAQTPEEALRARLESQLDLLELHGFSGAVLVEGTEGPELLRGLGFADRTSGIRSTPETLFSIASLTKHFTGAAVLRLDQEGKWSTSDSVGKLWPERLKGFSEVTLDQLLNHRSGLPDNCGDAPGSREDFLSCLEAIQNPEPPGRKFEYSNAGYALLAALIERVTGQSYAEHLRSRLLEPAGMVESGFLDEVDRWPAGRVATQYTWTRDFGTEIKVPIDWNFRGSADLVSSAEELKRWRKHLLGGFLDATHLQRLWGLAIVVEGSGSHSTWCLDGAMTLGYSARWCAGERGQILVLANQTFGLAPSAPPVAAILERVLYGSPPVLDWQPKPDAIPDLASWSGRYRWDQDSELEVDVENGTLRISGRGQPAVNWLVAADGNQARALGEASERASDLMAALVDHDYSRAAASSGDPGSSGALQGWLTGLEAQRGAFKEGRVVGTIPQGAGSRSYVELEFEQGVELRRLRWTGRQITSILSASLPLAPVYFVPVAGDRLIGYHLAFPGRGPIELRLLPRRRSIRVQVDGRWRRIDRVSTE